MTARVSLGVPMKRVLTTLITALLAVGAIVAAGVAADSKPGKGSAGQQQSAEQQGRDPVVLVTAPPLLQQPTSTAYPPPPVDTEELAWCSPGFWKNADPAAWDLTGYTKDTLFNDTGAVAYYGAELGDGVTLGAVLASPKTYSGPSAGGPLNAFNAVGAMLTDALDGYQYGASSSCPVNNHGVIS